MEALAERRSAEPSGARGQVPSPSIAVDTVLEVLTQAVQVARAGEGASPMKLEPLLVQEVPAALWRPLFDAVLVARHADLALELLMQCGFLPAVLPELAKIVGFGDGESHKDVWLHTRQVVIQSIPRLPVRWAALLHDIGKPRTRSVAADGTVHFFHHAEEGARMVERLDRRLQLFAGQPELAATVRFLVLHHQRAHQYEEDWTDSAVRRFAKEMGADLDDLMALSRADMTTKRREKRRRFLFQLKHLQDRIEQIQAEDSKVPPLPKGIGDALMSEFGLPPSRRVGEIRAQLESLVEAGELPAQQPIEVYLDAIRAQRERFGL